MKIFKESGSGTVTRPAGLCQPFVSVIDTRLVTPRSRHSDVRKHAIRTPCGHLREGHTGGGTELAIMLR